MSTDTIACMLLGWGLMGIWNDDVHSTLDCWFMIGCAYLLFAGAN